MAKYEKYLFKDPLIFSYYIAAGKVLFKAKWIDIFQENVSRGVSTVALLWEPYLPQKFGHYLLIPYLFKMWTSPYLPLGVFERLLDV